MARRELTCLSAFTGLGGIDLGVEAAGFKHLGCIEWDRDARRSLVLNRGDDWPLRGEDIAEAASRLQPDDLGIAAGELGLLVGAPPCQPYSKAAQWTAEPRPGMGDRRGQYLNDFLRLADNFLPQLILIENVRGFVRGTQAASDHIRAHFCRLANETGIEYRYDERILDASDYGVPQKRSRAIIIISRADISFEWPEPQVERTAWDAIGGLPTPSNPPVATGKWADLLPSIPEGCNYLWHTERGGGERLFGYRTRYWSFLLKLARDQPSWTLPAQPGPATGPFHWDNRPLTIAELLALQTFPPSWQVAGQTRVDQVRQVGNATPPLLAELIARCLAVALDRSKTYQEVPRYLLPKQPSPPPAEPPLAPVATKYLELIAEHEAHPGSGKGPGAMKALERRAGRPRLDAK